MKTVPWMVSFAALVALPAIAAAQGVPVPNKFKNASPEVRAAYGLPPEPAEQSPPIDISSLRAFAGRDRPSCAAVKVSAPVKFRNRTLVEIPDITEPDLRLANQLMSTGCFSRAVDRLEAQLRVDARSRNAKYVIARLTWMLMDTPSAERVLTQTIAEHGDFVSAKVLLAGIRFEQEKLAEVERLLNETEPRSPTDMWIYLNRLHIEALRAPSRDLRAQLLEIARSPAFPPNARESAAESARLLPNQTNQEYEEVLWARLDIDSSVGMACKATELAHWLGEEDGHYDQVIKLFESPRAKASNCGALAMNRTLLAQAYLMEAAKISAGPSAANQHLLRRADEVLNGDYTAVAAYVIGRPQEEKLRPFLRAYVQPDEEDTHGETNLCRAIEQLDVEAVRAQLDAGADPKGRCRQESLVGSLVFMATNKKPEQRREIMRALIQHGAPVTNIDACRSPDNGDCSKVLLPVMERK